GIVKVIGVLRRVEEESFRHLGRRNLAQRRHVVEKSERTGMRGGKQIVALDHKIMHRRTRQIELQALPMAAVVERDEDAGFGGGIEQSALHRVLTNRMDEGTGRKSGVDARPCLAAVIGLEDVRVDVVEL